MTAKKAKKAKKRSKGKAPLHAKIVKLIAEGGVETKRYIDKQPMPIGAKEHEEASLAFVAQYRARAKAIEDRRNDMAKHKEKLTGIDARMAELSDMVEGHVMRVPVECVELVMPGNEMRCLRIDTGEDVEKARPAEAADLQPELFDDGEDDPE